MAKAKKNYSFEIGRSAGNINLATGHLNFIHIDAKTNKNILPIEVTHVYNNENNNTYFGKGFNLNLCQSLVKKEDGSYEYKDGYNNAYIFNELFYYKDNENKRIYTKEDGSKVEKKDVKINYDGSLLYNEKEVFNELKTESGLTLKTDNTDYKNSDKIDFRYEEVATLEDGIEEIKGVLADLKFNLENEYKKFDENFINNINYKTLLESQKSIEDISYGIEKKIVDQFHELYVYVGNLNDKLRAKINDYDEYTKKELLPIMGGIVINGGASKFDKNASAYTYIDDDGMYAYAYERLYENEIGLYKNNENSTGGLIDNRGEYKRLWRYSQDLFDAKVSEAAQNVTIATREVEKQTLENNKILMADKYTLLNKQEIYLENKSIYEKRYNNALKEYYQLLKLRATEQIKRYEIILEYKEYQLEMLYKQVPINFIISLDNVIHGFNKYNQLSIIFDAYENVININYNEKNQIQNIINNNDEDIEFIYNINDQLIKIIDSENRETVFSYQNEYLTKITYPNEEFAILKYQNDKLNEIINIDQTSIYLQYENDKIIRVFKRAYLINSDKEYELIKEKVLHVITYKENETKVMDCKTEINNNYFFDSEGYLITEYVEKKTIIESITTYDKTDHCENVLTTTKKDETIFELEKAENVVTRTFIVTEFLDNVTDYVLSGFALANSNEINDNRKTEFCDHLDLVEQNTNYNAKFQIECNVKYSNKTKTYKMIFDYKNKGKQFKAIQVVLDEDLEGRVIKPEEIQIILNYSNNNGECLFESIRLSTGDYIYSEYDCCGNKIYECYNEIIEAKTNNGEKNGKFVTKIEGYFNYDDNSNLIRQCANVVKEEYDLTGYIIDRKVNEYITKYEYNKQNKLVRTINPQGMITEQYYNTYGQAIKKIIYHKSNPSLKYYDETKVDETGKIICNIDTLGNETTYDYLEDTAIVERVTNSKNQSINYGVDYETKEIISISSTTNGENNYNTMEYEKGLLKALTNQNNTYEFEYDCFGRQQEVKINGELYVSFSEYIEDGLDVYKTLYKTNEGYEIKKNQYSEILEVEKITDREKATILKYGYLDDKLNKTIDYTNEIPFEASYIYEKETLIKEINNDYIKTLDYDIDGNASKLEYEYADDSQEYIYGYDTFGSLKTVIYNNNLNIELTNDKLNRLEKLEIIDSNKCHLIESKYTYLSKNNHTSDLITSVETKTNNGLARTKYIYDSVGNIKEIKGSKENNRYIYDDLNRLIREDNMELDYSYTYDYDNNGNIISKTNYRYCLENLSNGIKKIYNYNNDLLVEYDNKEITYNELGNPVIYKGKVLKWDIRNLINVDDILYKYNASNIRTYKKNKNEETRYILEGNRILKEIRIKYDTYLATYFEEPTYPSKEEYEIKYIYGVNGILGFEINRGNGVTKRYYYLKNIQGDILEIIDGEGKLVAKYTYDAWGNHEIIVNIDDIASINPFRYRGYYYDSETSMFYCNARYYDPEIGRFISPDSIDYLEPESINGLNLYCYCGNNPILYADPSGHSVILALLIGAGIGALVGGASYAVSEGISFAITGKFTWSWEMFGASVIGGAIGGVLTPFFGPVATAFITGFSTTSIGMGLENLNGKRNYSFSEIFLTSLLVGSVSGMTAGILDRVKIPGFNSGRGSISAISKQINTKLLNGQIGRISAQTFGKMLFLNVVYSLPATIFNGLFDNHSIDVASNYKYAY